MQKKMILIFLVTIFLAILAAYMERAEMPLNEEGQLLRQEVGMGNYEVELLLQIEEGKEQEFLVQVPEQTMTQDEEAQYLDAAIAEIEAEIKGENTSFAEIRNQIVIRENYQNGLVSAEWKFSNYRLFEADGKIVESCLGNAGEEICASVLLKCGESRVTQLFWFKVYPVELSEEELLYEKINAVISENGKAEGTQILELPTQVEGRSLSWKNKKIVTPVQIFFLGSLITLLIPELEKERKKEEKKKREEKLLQEYPEMVNKLTLLMGAGMTIQKAWVQITDMYLLSRQEKQVNRNELYEEMLITRHEMESGRGEMRSYEAFGERCGLPRYRKFSAYLVQNLQKGSSSICEILEKEAMDVFTEKKNMARRYGEEATTKLLLPMLLMLGIVIFIIMVPAVISFQMGT